MNNFYHKHNVVIKSLGGILCLLLGVLIYIHLMGKEDIEINRITLADLQPKQDFYLVGSIEPTKIVELKFDKSKGKITEKKVNLNDHVEPGQELFVYSNPEGAMAIKEAEQAVANREKAIEQARLESSMKWEQYNKLSNQIKELANTISKAPAEEKKTLQERKDELDIQLSQSLLDAKTSDNSITDAELELEKMQLELQNTRNQYGVNVITAEISGEIKEIDDGQMNMNPSEKTPEKPFMTILDTSQLYLRGNVDEFRKSQLKIDQKVQLMDRNGGTQRWTGRITKIGDLKQATVVDDEQGGNPNLSQFAFEVALDASDTPPSIGLHCFVELVKEEEQVLKVPKNFVLEDKKKHYIMINQKGKVVRQKIKVSADPDDEEMYRLDSPLEVQTELIFPTNEIKEGMKLDGVNSAE
ncbi:HlyD family efflux transporter periplasmic adaptor subunit [Enterococcus faecium]|nr:HlyD family efflux transporter periplasmic adaptor subunit [Enterococcus faecium]